MPFRRRGVAAFAAAGAIACGCDAGAAEDAGAAADDAAAADSATVAEAPPPPEPLPDRIYFNLTDYDWYARGEPLVFSDVRYEVGRDLVAAPLDAMRKVGEYDGVDVYSRADSTDAALYVPVFPGYWLPFQRAAATAASGS